MSDTFAGLLQLGVLILALAVCYRPLGVYMARVYSDSRHLRVERGLYRIMGSTRTPISAGRCTRGRGSVCRWWAG